MTETTANTSTNSPAAAGSEISPPPGAAAPPPSGKPDRVTAVGNLALGSLLIALEALDGWVDRNVPTQEQALDQRARVKTSLRTSCCPSPNGTRPTAGRRSIARALP